MDKTYEFSEGDAVRINEGEFASFYGKVVRVHHQNERLTVEGRFEGQSDSGLHTLNVSFSVVEKVEGPGNSD
jgi:transcription antitermination factor NusG